MIGRVLFLTAFVALGFESPKHSQAFLSAAPAAEEEMGPNMKFSPISTTMSCVINLTIQYILVFTALGVCRSYLDLNGMDHGKSAAQKALKHASETVFYAPMTCLLFIGFRMRVLQLTKGTGDPQDWVRFCMQACAYTILANTVLVLVVPIFADTEIELEETGEMKVQGANPFKSDILMYTFTGLRYIAMLLLYIGFGGVVIGLYRFTPDPSIWDGAVPPVSPAVNCTAILSCCFFCVYCLVAVSRTYTQLVAGSAGLTKFENAMLMAANTMAFAPMLCVLFLGCRMRALQMDPISGNPQKWAQNCFYMCTYAIVTQTICAVAVPLVLGGSVKKGEMGEGDMEYDLGSGNAMVAKGLTVFRFIIMLCVYTGAIAIVCSAYMIEHPQGAHLTPPLSPTMQCVVNLTTQYFLIYFLLWVFITIEDLSGWKGLSFARDVVETTKSTVQFAPMLCVLFIITRMRALQISKNRGSPQGWAQDGMYLASWSVLVQFLMCLIMPFFTRKVYKTDSLDGSSSGKEGDSAISNPIGAWIVTIIRYLALVALFGGVIAVITSVFLITPETANGRGSFPLVGDYVGAPPSVEVIPGAKATMETVGPTVGGTANTVSDTTNKVNPVAF